MQAIPDMSCTELVNLCLELGLTGYDDIKEKKGKMHKFVMKNILEFETNQGDQGQAKFVQMYNYLKANAVHEQDRTEEEPKPPILTATLTDNNNDFMIQLSKLAQSLKDGKPLQSLKNEHGEKPQPAPAAPPLVVQPDLTSLLQTNPDLLLKLLQQQQNQQKEVKPAMVVKDLKFSGVIAGEGESSSDKTRISFSSLCYKIRNAQKQRYPEAAICNAILEAIVPSNHLKTYFEMRPTLTINAMLSKLKSLYKEKGSTETLIELSRAAQFTSETCIQFCSRLMCLRDKYILLAEEEDAGSVDKVGLSKKFMKSLAVGMRNANVRNELRESCKNLYKGEGLDEDDNKLLELVSEAMANEVERNQRFQEGKKVELSLMQANAATKEIGKTANCGSRKEKVTHQQANPSSLQLEELKLEQYNQGQQIVALGSQLSEIASVLVNKPNASYPAAPPARPPTPSAAPSAPGATPRLQMQPPQPLMQPLLPPPNNAPNQQAAQQPRHPNPMQNQQPPNQNVLPPNQLAPTNQHYQQNGNQNNYSGQWSQGNQFVPPQGNQYVPPHRRSNKCQTCEAENRWRCFHCFYCGSNSHQIGNCPAKN